MAHESEASNLLKLNYKINDKVVGYLLDSRATNLFMTLQVAKRLGIKIEWVANPIIVQLAPGIARPSLNVLLEVELFCDGI
jgi:predicted aspartyl protease